jgi:hypothetical protein
MKMKYFKKFIILSLIFAYFNCVALTTNTENEGPTLRTAIIKVGVGSVGIAVSSLLESTEMASSLKIYTSNIGFFVSCKFFCDGLYDLTEIAYKRFCNGPVPSKEGGKKQTKEAKRAFLAHQKETDLTWNKISIGIHSGLNILSSSMLLYRYYNAFIAFGHLGINPFSTELMEGCRSFPSLCRPIVTSLMALTQGGILFYNAQEFLKSWKSKNLRQSDVPILGLILGWNEIGLGGMIFQYCSYTKITQSIRYLTVEEEGSLDTFSWLFHQGFIKHGNTQMYANLLQMLWNMGAYFYKKPNILIEDIPVKKNKEKVKNQFLPTKIRTQFEKKILENQNLQNILIKDEQIEHKKKIKTHGVEDLSRAKKFLFLEKEEERTQKEQKINLEQEKIRQRGLSTVNNYRRFNARSKTEINALLNDVCKFVNGELKSIDGSEWAIVFEYGEKRISIKYEIPHGNDSAVFKGYKLQAVLGAMETAFLYGSSEEGLEKYMFDHGLDRLYRVPEFLLYTLCERAKL